MRSGRGKRAPWLLAEDDIEQLARRSDPDRIPGGPWMSTEEAARRSGLSEATVTYRVRRGLVHAIRNGSGKRAPWLIAEDEVFRLRARARKLAERATSLLNVLDPDPRKAA